MQLPIVAAPEYELNLPISGKKIKYRPYLVKEQKVLLMALESGDEKAMINAIATVMDNCVTGDMEALDLPITDFEWLFLKLRSASYSEMTELRYLCKCQPNPDQDPCGNIVTIPLNLKDIAEPVVAKKANIIMLSSTLGVTLDYPSYRLMGKFQNFNYENTIEMVKDCISNVFDLENIYTRKQFSEKDLNEWIDSLSQVQFDKILQFFNDIPILQRSIHFRCTKCGHQEDINLEGIQSFFV